MRLLLHRFSLNVTTRPTHTVSKERIDEMTDSKGRNNTANNNVDMREHICPLRACNPPRAQLTRCAHTVNITAAAANSVASANVVMPACRPPHNDQRRWYMCLKGLRPAQECASTCCRWVPLLSLFAMMSVWHLFALLVLQCNDISLWLRGSECRQRKLRNCNSISAFCNVWVTFCKLHRNRK